MSTFDDIRTCARVAVCRDEDGAHAMEVYVVRVTPAQLEAHLRGAAIGDDERYPTLERLASLCARRQWSAEIYRDEWHRELIASIDRTGAVVVAA